MSQATIACPFCSEQIQASAKKCKHCGEWLDTRARPTGSGAHQRGSSDARAVTKGLKEKELHDSVFNVLAFLLLVASGATWWLTGSWVYGLVVLVAGMIPVGWWYYKE